MILMSKKEFQNLIKLNLNNNNLKDNFINDNN